MCRKCCCAHAIVSLVAVLLILPIAVTVLLATAFILDAMGDAAGKMAIGYIALGLLIVWVIGLIVLVLLQGLRLVKEAQCCCRSHPSAEGEVVRGIRPPRNDRRAVYCGQGPASEQVDRFFRTLIFANRRL